MVYRAVHKVFPRLKTKKAPSDFEGAFLRLSRWKVSGTTTTQTQRVVSYSLQEVLYSEQPPTGRMILEKIFLARGNLLRNVKNFWQKNLKKRWLVRNKYQKNQMRSSPKKVRWKTCSANFIASFFITRFWELCFFKQSLAFSLCLNQFLLNYLFCNDFSVIKNDTMITKERNRRCGNQQIRPSSTF